MFLHREARSTVMLVLLPHVCACLISATREKERDRRLQQSCQLGFSLLFPRDPTCQKAGDMTLEQGTAEEDLYVALMA